MRQLNCSMVVWILGNYKYYFSWFTQCLERAKIVPSIWLLWTRAIEMSKFHWYHIHKMKMRQNMLLAAEVLLLKLTLQSIAQQIRFFHFTAWLNQTDLNCFVKFKVTVTNNKKPPPYTTDIYMSDVPVSGNEFSLNGRKMEWICTQEREGFDRNDQTKAGFLFVIWSNHFKLSEWNMIQFENRYKSMADRTGACNSAEIVQIKPFTTFIILAVFFI